MTVSAEDLAQRSRDALPYFQEARQAAGPAMEKDRSDVSSSDYPQWVLQIEEAARDEIGAEWKDTHFYGLIAETLMDAEEFVEMSGEESLAPVEVIDELATNVSVSAYNEELVEWSRESSEWSDVSDDLENYHTGDSEIDLELLPEGMSDDIRRIRHAVLDVIYRQLLDDQRHRTTN